MAMKQNDLVERMRFIYQKLQQREKGRQIWVSLDSIVCRNKYRIPCKFPERMINRAT